MSDLRRVYIKSLTENLEMYFPITPFVNIKESMNTTTQDLFGFGEIDSGSSVKLDTWSIEGFFPDISNNYDFDLSYDKYPSTWYVETLSRWMKQQQVLVFQYYVADGYYAINNYFCKITSFSHGEKNGNKNVYYTLDFREYKTMNVNGQYFIVDNNAVIAKYGSDTYTIADGDTLISIAQKIFGDSTKWSYLMVQNELTNPLDIKVGQVLKI